MTNIKQFNFDQMVSNKNGKSITTSLKVAEYFTRKHKSVLRSIRMLECSKEFASAHFCAYVQDVAIGNGATKKTKVYEMDFQGFMFLVMGFTGREAAQIKETYINAFDWMHEQLTSFMNTANEVIKAFNNAKESASHAGRELKQWQINKPTYERKLKELEDYGQAKLSLG